MKHSISIKNIMSKKNRVLLSELVRTDFKLRYQGSVLGYLWSLLRPLFLFIILYVVFVRFLRIGGDVPHYPVYLLIGIILWNFFSETTQMGLNSIVGRGDLIRKIKIPRWIIVISSSLSALINLALNGVVIIVFMYINKVEISPGIIFVPLAILQLYVFALGIAFLLSAAFVKYRDISYIWEIFLQAGFYATPILYPISIITNVTIQKILFLNPVAQVAQFIRSVMVTSTSITVSDVFEGSWKAAIPIIITIVVFVIGALYFRRESKYFAENL